jgi:transcriptional regulator with PAS, ATPase and Fis domain
VSLNCGAIAKNLAESTLEGAKKGAFTGATADQPGVVRSAHGGTLFLDEIGEMSFDMQSKLLRILQERSVMPLGSTTAIPVDFRLVCATNKNLKAEVSAGRFREDLFFRLSTFPIQLPPLRDREDFDIIANEIWDIESHAENLLPPYGDYRLSDVELLHLRLCRWPGNIRQLKNVLQRYALLRPHGITLEEILQDEFSGSACREIALTQQIPTNKSPAWPVIENILHKFGGNKMQTARALGISRSNLYLQIKKATLQSPQASQTA